MSLLSSVQRKSMPGAVTLPNAKPLTSLPKIPALPRVGAIGGLQTGAAPVRTLGLMKQTVIGPSSLLQTFGVKRLGGKSLGL